MSPGWQIRSRRTFGLYREKPCRLGASPLRLRLTGIIEMNPDRYSRQVILPEIGQEGQAKMAQSSVLCVGAGGLGSPALLYLAAAGIGRIGLIDPDRVDESNLQRQVLYDTAQVGQFKARAASQRLADLNPHIRIEAYQGELDADAAAELVPAYDIILDGTDNFAAKFLINDASVKFGKPWVYSAIQGFEAQVAVFNYEGSACYRCLYPYAPLGHIANCAEGGIIGAVAGIAGVTQALQVIKIITGHEGFEPLTGTLWTLDARTMATRTLFIPRDAACPCCSKNPEEIILEYEPQNCEIIDREVQEISVEGAQSIDNAFYVDVREEYEWAGGAIEGAAFLPLSRLMDGHAPDLPEDRTIVLYCAKGVRSRHAATMLKARGVHNVVNLRGGYEAWLRENA